MRIMTITTVWAATPETTVIHGETSTVYENLHAVPEANLQTDYSELDAAEYGARVSEMMRMRFTRVPDLKKGDHVYLNEPENDMIPGDYVVVSVKPGYHNPKLLRNPTVVDMKKVTK